MKSVVLSIHLACAILVCACGSSEKRDVCDEAQEIIQQAVDNYCSDRDSQCWYCKCHNRGQEVGVDVVEDSYFCKDPDPCQDDPDTDENECRCEGDQLLQAEACLADIDECQAPHLAHAVSSCSGTPI